MEALCRRFPMSSTGSPNMSKFNFFRWPRLAVAVLIVYWLGLVAGTHLPGPAVSQVHYNDKAAHFLAYAGLAFLLSWVWSTRRPSLPKGPVFAFLVAALYGGCDELTQLLVPGRSAELADWSADMLGAAIGIGVFAVLETLSRRITRPSRSQSP